MKSLRIALRALSPIFVALLPVACGGGGGSGTPALNVGVDLSGPWTLTTRVTAVAGPCSEVVGQTETMALTFVHDVANATLVISAGTPDSFSGALTGALATLSRMMVTGGVTDTDTVRARFDAAGTTVTGTATSTSTDGTTTCTVETSFDGTRVGGGGGNPVQAFLQGIATDNGTMARLETGTPPAAAGGPQATVAGSTTVINGGTSLVVIGATGGGAFESIAISIAGQSGFYQLDLPAPETFVQLVVALGQALPANVFDCVYQVRAAGVWGTPQSVTITRTNAGTGDLQINLTWNSSADIDLHLVEPSGEEIYYGNPSSAGGGVLDLDSNAACDPGPSVENITYQNATPPSGTYIVRVDNWDACGNATTEFVVRVNRVGQAPLVFTGTFSDPGTGGSAGAGREITTFSF